MLKDGETFMVNLIAGPHSPTAMASSSSDFILAAMTIEQIKRKVDKMKKAQKDYPGRETPLPTKKDDGPDEPTREVATGRPGGSSE